jgi:hypothetical protein
MSFDVIYSYLIDLTWFFLGSWVILLAAAYFAAFSRDGIHERAKGMK